MYMTNRRGDIGEPCGTPTETAQRNMGNLGMREGRCGL